MSTIPVSQVANVIPNVISAGGAGLVLNGLVLSASYRVPIGSVMSFPSQPAVASFFGASSNEATAANIYFGGYVGQTQQPGAMLFAQYNTAAVPAYLQGGNISVQPITFIQSLSGTLSVVVDGVTRLSGVLNLSGATSFSNAAALIQTGLNAAPPVLAQYNAAISGTTLTIGTLTTGLVQIGQFLSGTGILANTEIVAFLSGTGGVGTYQVSVSQNAPNQSANSIAAPVSVTFDSVAGAFLIQSGIIGVNGTILGIGAALGVLSSIGFATGNLATSLQLTQATGAFLSQGAAPATPAAFMNAVTLQTQNWATFMLMSDPDNGVGNAQKQLFAQWVSGQNSRYAYIAGDTDTTPKNNNVASLSLGQLVQTLGYQGVCVIWDPNFFQVSAFICGTTAAINFSTTNGRITFAEKASGFGLTPAVTDLTSANNLLANGYNYYGAYATANAQFQFFYNGAVSGKFLFLDSFVNQIWLNSQLQLAIISFMTTVNAIPYNQAGYTQIENALYSTIAQGLDFGAYSSGVVLSSIQQSEVNSQAGRTIHPTLFQQGWYLQVLDPGAQVRAKRGSPIVNFWYCDGEAVQQITINSTQVQ
jgi:Protein of unknown function (DUF3383)